MATDQVLKRVSRQIIKEDASKGEYERFFRVCPEVEKFIVDSGIQPIKFWLEVGDEEQKRRFEARIEDPLRQWKLRACHEISISS